MVEAVAGVSGDLLSNSMNSGRPLSKEVFPLPARASPSVVLELGAKSQPLPTLVYDATGNLSPTAATATFSSIIPPATQNGVPAALNVAISRRDDNSAGVRVNETRSNDAESAPSLPSPLSRPPEFTAFNVVQLPAENDPTTSERRDATNRNTERESDAIANEEIAEPAIAASPTVVAVVAPTPPEALAPAASPVETGAENAALFSSSLESALFARSNVERNPSYAGMAATIYVNAMIHRSRQGSSDSETGSVRLQPVEAMRAAMPLDSDRNGPNNSRRSVESPISR